jgi:hypothetical protein
MTSLLGAVATCGRAATHSDSRVETALAGRRAVLEEAGQQ